MIDRTRYALALALLLAPLAARAQQPSHAAPEPATSPALVPANVSSADDLTGSLTMDDAQEPGGQLNHPPPGPGDMRMGMGDGMGARRAGLGRRRMLQLRLAQLDLSDAQRDKLRDLHEAHARRAIQRRADMQLARMDLHRLMRADKPDAGAVNSQIDKLARLHADGLKSRFELRMQARAVLTPEQFKKLHDSMEPMMMHHDMMDTPDGRPKR